MTTAAATARNTSRSRFQPQIDAIRGGLSWLRANAPVYGRRFWQEERHWLWVIVPMLALTALAASWCRNAWTAFDNALTFQPFTPLIAFVLAWSRRIEIRELQKEMTFLFPENSPKRRGKLWPVLMGGFLMLLAVVTTAPTIGLFGLVTVFVGGFYYIYGPFLARLLWLPFTMLYFMVPIPLGFLDKIAIPLKIGGLVVATQVLEAIVPGTHPRYGVIGLPHYELVVGSSLCGLNVLLTALFLTLSFCLIRYVKANYTLILMAVTAAIATILNFVRIILTGLIGNMTAALPDGQRDSLIAGFGSLFLIVLTAILVLYVVRLLDSNKFQRVSQFEADLREAAMATSIGPTVAEAAAVIVSGPTVAEAAAMIAASRAAEPRKEISTPAEAAEIEEAAEALEEEKAPLALSAPAEPSSASPYEIPDNTETPERTQS